MIVPARRQEQLLIDMLGELPSGRLLCNTAGRGQLAAAFARSDANAAATCWLLDLYQFQQAQAVCPSDANLRLLCAVDPPAEPFDCVAWAFSRQGESEFAREMLQIGHERLTIGGTLFAAIDYPKDRWLGEQLERIFSKVSRRQHETGVVYAAVKTADLRKKKNYAAEFAFRDGARLVHLRTRPGVFSHRDLDGGARALLKSMPVEDGMRILDLGCGSGAVGLAAALRAGTASVTALDSNARAIEATLFGKERNRVMNLEAKLDCDGSSVEGGEYQLVLANPPYYSDFRIAELFVRTAERALAPRGMLYVVTKNGPWYLDRLPKGFHGVESRAVGHYTVVCAERT